MIVRLYFHSNDRMSSKSGTYAQAGIETHFMAACSPPRGKTSAGRIWSKVPASHWASTLSNDSVYETHCCAKNEPLTTDQSTAGNCR